MNFSDLDLSFEYKDDLREYANCPKDIELAIDRLKTNFNELEDVEKKVKILGQVGSYCRSLRRLDEAASFFDEALSLVEKHELGKKLEIANRIRRTHVHHWKGEFETSNRLFDAIVDECSKNDEISDYLDFAYQHRGKNYFDQGEYDKALKDFYQANSIRNKKDDKSLSDSTLFAIEMTKQKAYPQIDSKMTSELLSQENVPTFIKKFIGKNEEPSGFRSNCINASVNCFKNTEDYLFEPVRPMDFINQLKDEFEQFYMEPELKNGDLVVFWNREENGSWDNRSIQVKEIDPKDPDFPFGIIFDHVAYVVGENIVFNKPNPSPQSQYKFDYLETAMIPAKLSYGFEVTYHRRKTS